MIVNYYIAGYAVKEICPPIRTNVPTLYKIYLILISTNLSSVELLYLNDCQNGFHYHSYGKKSNYFQIVRAVYGFRDVIKAFILKLTCTDFLGHYISYNTGTKRWIKTNDSCMALDNTKKINVKELRRVLLYPGNLEIYLDKFFHNKLLNG